MEILKTVWGSLGSLNIVSWAWCRQERTMKTLFKKKIFPGPVHRFQANWEQREQYPALLLAMWRAKRKKSFAHKWAMKDLQWRLCWVHFEQQRVFVSTNNTDKNQIWCVNLVFFKIAFILCVCNHFSKKIKCLLSFDDISIQTSLLKVKAVILTVKSGNSTHFHTF